MSNSADDNLACMDLKTFTDMKPSEEGNNPNGNKLYNTNNTSHDHHGA